MLWPNGSATHRPNLSAEGHFGWRNSTAPGASKYHRGQDFWGLGIVRSIEDGTVVFVGWGSEVGWGGGYQVWIQHDGFFTRSLHLVDGSAPVRKGDHVKAGDPIGTEGMTGAYQVHLHLEVTPGSWHTANVGQVDPVAFITARLTTGAPASAPQNAPASPEEDDMPLHENKSYTGLQRLERGKFWPIRVSGTQAKPEHRFASCGPRGSETGTLVADLQFTGGRPGEQIAQVRTRHEELLDGKWVTRKDTPVAEVIGTHGDTAHQYVVQYAIGPNYQSSIIVATLLDGVHLERVEYTKNYWKS